ncbi:MAG: ribonuclease HII [Xanthomonadales bacterium]|nr:ribonuclease HII [Xanthomonadales bacterium]NIN59291.1 ribonuclease HII [Xanthomonadales bacterium]NIN74653.1 ribonuclease HII [Xanthomonadales bacterium]NIO13319.1 ribonuclease HII [Xanthomonadales bacterium]NIP11684.1 ribonuclease HII [Xanthomonadales bacterium]
MNLGAITREHVFIAGVDEAGRGPLAGPVVVAAAMLPDRHGLHGLDDSKRLSAARREQLFPDIERAALSYDIQIVDVEEIDRENILTATFNGMQRAVRALDPQPTLILVDGDRAPELDGEVRTIIEGDHWVPSISAASILAKVTRDRIMEAYDREFPGYGFGRHKGYATPEHLQRLGELGPCRIHRRSFAPVRELLEPSLF